MFLGIFYIFVLLRQICVSISTVFDAHLKKTASNNIWIMRPYYLYFPSISEPCS